MVFVSFHLVHNLYRLILSLACGFMFDVHRLPVVTTMCNTELFCFFRTPGLREEVLLEPWQEERNDSNQAPDGGCALKFYHRNLIWGQTVVKTLTKVLLTDLS